MGLILDIVPNHMATDDANRYWSDPELRERFFDIDAETGRHRRFFDIDHLAAVRQEDEAVFEETHKLALALVRDGRRRRPADRPSRTGSPTRPATCGGCATAARDHVWVEKILDPGEQLRDWPVDGTVGYEFLNDVAALFVDPAGEAPLTALWEEVSGDARPFSAYADEAKLEQARHDVRARGRAAARARRRASRSAGSSARSPSLPVYRTYVEPWSGDVAPEDRRGDRGGGAAGVARARAAPGGARLGRVRDALPADDAAGHGQGRRGHRLLPLRAGCSRSTTSAATRAASGSRSRTSTPPTPSAPSASRATCSSPRRTTPSARATCARGSARCRRWPEEWAARVRALARAHRATLDGPDDVERYFDLPDARRRLADRARAPAGVHREGAARGQAHDELGRARRGARGRRCRRSARRSTSTRRSSPTSSRSRPSWPRAGDRAALAQLLLKLTVPGPARRLPGRRAALALARGPRQPPPGRLGGAPARARRAAPRRRARRTRRASCG